jgi:hypothetical protein
MSTWLPTQEREPNPDIPHFLHFLRYPSGWSWYRLAFLVLSEINKNPIFIRSQKFHAWQLAHASNSDHFEMNFHRSSALLDEKVALYNGYIFLLCKINPRRSLTFSFFTLFGMSSSEQYPQKVDLVYRRTWSLRH